MRTISFLSRAKHIFSTRVNELEVQLAKLDSKKIKDDDKINYMEKRKSIEDILFLNLKLLALFR
jgi:hypothetical protein